MTLTSCHCCLLLMATGGRVRFYTCMNMGILEPGRYVEGGCAVLGGFPQTWCVLVWCRPRTSLRVVP